MEMYFFRFGFRLGLIDLRKNFSEEKRGKEEFIAEKLFKSFPEGPQYMSEKDIIRIIEWAGFNRDPKEEISISYIQYLWGKKWEKANPGRPCLSDEAYISQLRY